MYKDKDGKVIASLTEVKNRTGDIFAVVEEFGEISLTSYTKIRYRITKVDIDDVFAEGKKAPVEKKKFEVKKTEETQHVVATKEEIEVPVKHVEVEEKKEVEEDKPTTPVNPMPVNPIAIVVWDRNSRDEMRFIDEAIKPLIS